MKKPIRPCADIQILGICNKAESQAFYIPKLKTIVISSVNEKRLIRDLTESITHETLHYLIHKIAGYKATLDFDKLISKKHLNRYNPQIVYGCIWRRNKI